jgi:hypothetical protein
MRSLQVKRPACMISAMDWPRGGLPCPVENRSTWISIAEHYRVRPCNCHYAAGICPGRGTRAWGLIYYNFRTCVPEEVNWYLHEFVGCTKSDDGYNYKFTTGLKGGKGNWRGGYIALPPETANICPGGECDFSSEGLEYNTWRPPDYLRVPDQYELGEGLRFLQTICEAAHKRARNMDKIVGSSAEEIGEEAMAIIGNADNVLSIADAVGISVGVAGEIVPIVAGPAYLISVLIEIGRSNVIDIANGRRGYYQALASGMTRGIAEHWSGQPPQNVVYRYVYYMGYEVMRNTNPRTRNQLVFALIDEYYRSGGDSDYKPRKPSEIRSWVLSNGGRNIYDAFIKRFNNHSYLYE